MQFKAWLPYIVAGYILPTAVWCLSDWCHVRDVRCEDFWVGGNAFFWGVWGMLGAFFFFAGSYKVFEKKAIPTAILPLVLFAVLFFVDMIVLFNFHFLIGGWE